MGGQTKCKRCNNRKKQCTCGRPTKKTEEVVGKLEDILKIDGTVSEACNYAGINQCTYYDRLKKDPQFSKKMQAAQDYPFILSRRTLMKAIVRDEDAKAAIEYLKRRDKRYKDKAAVELDANIDVTSATDEELDKLLAPGA